MNMRMMPDTLRSEIKQITDILKRWQERLDEGVPGDEMAANDMNIATFRYQLRGEIMLAAERLTSIAEVLES